MEKDKIGAILGKRIKECGYTQEAFAEKSGISLASLKKYIRGSVAYNYEVLDILATELDCSYDYLLGKSPSPKREYHEITEQTHLSEEAIRNINKRAKYYEDDIEARRYILVLDKILCEETAFESISNYLFSTKPFSDIILELLEATQQTIYKNPSVEKLGIQSAKLISLEAQEAVDVIIHLKELKQALSSTFIELMSEFKVIETYREGIKMIKEFTE